MPLALVKGAHATGGVLQRRANLRRGAGGHLVPLGGGELQRAELALLESRRQLAHGAIAAGAHLGDHLARGRVDLVGNRGLPVAERLEAGDVVGVVVLEDLQHGRSRAA